MTRRVCHRVIPESEIRALVGAAVKDPNGLRVLIPSASGFSLVRVRRVLAGKYVLEPAAPTGRWGKAQ